MKKTVLFSILALMNFMLGYGQTFTLTSIDVGGQATKKQVFTGCGGENQSPQLKWSNAPKGTKSFAVTIHDKDAPTGSGWWHWLVFDIPADVNELKTNAGNTSFDLMPKNAIQSKTDFGGYGYGGPCPPKGTGIHQYMITVYALDKESLDLDKDANPALVGFKLNFATIEKASIVMYYETK